MLRLLSVLPALLLAVACARPPEAELRAARAALQAAREAGAAEQASSQYLAAEATLLQAEYLFRQGRYASAGELLPVATAQAGLAETRARRASQDTAPTKLTTAPVETGEASGGVPARSHPRPARRQMENHPPPPPPSLFIVARNESLREIAAREEVYGDPLLWPLLYKANRDQISDPRLVHRGQTLAIPRRQTASELDEARREALKSNIFPVAGREP